MAQPLIPPFGKSVSLKTYDPDDRSLFSGDKKDAARDMERDIERLAQLQEAFYAEGKRALLIVLQGMDTSGKDGVIRHVFKGLNPQGVQISNFKAPTSDELARDFLWRVHKAVPPKGWIGVFNRSHYEDVLIVRVHDLVPPEIWQERYDHINRFEEMLIEHGTTILKFYLHISKQEQKERLLERRDTPEKQWKFNPSDVKERAHWDDYTLAYEALLTKCHSERAPWHIVPSNTKWYRNYAITQVLINTFEQLNPQFPKPAPGIETVEIPD